MTTQNLATTATSRPAKEIGTLGTLRRSLGYAAAAGIALTAGYLLRGDALNLGNWFLLGIAWLASWPFFIAYAICFHYETLRPDVQFDSFVISYIIASFAALSLFAAYRATTSHFPSMNYSLAFFVYLTLFLTYGIYLYLHFRGGEAPIRHQLVWPVVLSIAFMLYFPVFLESEPLDQRLYYPLVACVLFFF